MTILGQLYHYGRDVTQGYEEARKLYEKAAALGNPNAMTSLGFLYDRGSGVAQDYTEARKWYEKAAALGFGQAMSNLGFLYEKGRGVTQDHKEARKWYEKGAAVGNGFAMNNLGPSTIRERVLLRTLPKRANGSKRRPILETHWRCGISATNTKKGRGVPKDRQQARQWYQKAADAGDEEAKKKARRVQVTSPSRWEAAMTLQARFDTHDIFNQSPSVRGYQPVHERPGLCCDAVAANGAGAETVALEPSAGIRV